MSRRVLLAHSMLWPNIARLATGFRKAGFSVDAIAPAAHPIHQMDSSGRNFAYQPKSAYRALRDAIYASRPDIIVPCDDRVVSHLHRLHEEASEDGDDGPDKRWLATLVARSLGSPRSFPLVRSRSLLGTLGELPDVHVPNTAPVDSLALLRDWIQQNGLPAVLKLDGSSGGRDVILIRKPTDIVPGFLHIRLRRSALRHFKSLLDGDPEPFFTARQFAPERVSAQSYVYGKVANCAIACWGGDVLASVAVEVIQSRGAFGLATVVRRVQGEAMVATARSVARYLQLSGLFGFDFVIDHITNRPQLIEINPRATQINHLPGHDGSNMFSALFAALCNQPVTSSTERMTAEEVALFPQEWQRDPSSAWLSKAYHDVPRDLPELLKYYGYQSGAP